MSTTRQYMQVQDKEKEEAPDPQPGEPTDTGC